MAATGNRIDVSRGQFVELLFQDLRYRWLKDSDIVDEVIRAYFGRQHSKRQKLVSRIVLASKEGKLADQQLLRRWLMKDSIIKQLFAKRKTISIEQKTPEESLCNRWPLPELANLSQLADFLLLSSPAVLDWLTLPHRRRKANVNHFLRRSIRKRDGTIRWIEEPKPILKRVQRIIAREILEAIPLHAAASGFRRGYRVIDSARQHVDRKMVLRMDLQDFFPSISISRVRQMFMIGGYSMQIANVLGQLCTAPAQIDSEADPVLCHSRLPQGAPTSPALANAISFALDRRLAGLSSATNAIYTRYADDLIFSSDDLTLAGAKRFATTVAVIAMEEGFQINYRKTRFMRHGNRQQVLGLIVNQGINTPRQEYEILKAILHNAQHGGLESQNRQGHPSFAESIQGRIAYVASINRLRGERLMKMFNGL